MSEVEFEGVVNKVFRLRVNEEVKAWIEDLISKIVANSPVERAGRICPTVRGALQKFICLTVNR